MLGLSVLVIFAAYLLISGLVVWLAVRWAKKRNHKPWVWGGLAAFLMYNLVFWDLIPTLAMHKYYCATEAGFWVYKTPGQWAKENPGVAETLTWKRQAGYLRKDSRLNERFVLEHSTNRKSRLLPIRSMETTIKDTHTNEVMARAMSFSSGYGALGVGMRGAWRFWTHHKPCTPDSQLSAMIKQYERLGKEMLWKIF